jgi:acyl carrier protein
MNNHNEILHVVTDIIRNVTGNTGLVIEPNHTAHDIPNWDSLRHVMIINEIENHYAIQFELMEMLDINSVDDICKVVLNKQTDSQ